ncbi:MAG: 8-amino-7-oxononanoate synthase [Oleiphilaceae bacterium]
MSIFKRQWRESLQARKDAGLWRTHRTLHSPQGVNVNVDGRLLLAFCSNDYLGLANHHDVKHAAVDAINAAGVGSGASHLVIGHHREHLLLEEELAEFTQRDRALVFSSGYMANLAIVSTLVGKSDVVLEDKLNHASLIDGGLLSGARFQRYLHNDSASLERYLQRFRQQKQPFPQEDNIQLKQLVVTDGVFSMDGNVANLTGISGLCQQHDACLMVDDAHGLGVLGPEGRGSVVDAGLGQDDVPVLVGTFGKAFGTSGAFVAGSNELIEYLTQMARPYIYTTAMPPAIAAATRASLKLVQQADDKRAHLNQLIYQFRQGVSQLGFELMPSHTAIQPIMIGDTDKAMTLSRYMENEGILVTAIRPPTVPDKTARLRVTLSANHCFDDIDELLEVLAKAQRAGLA